MGQHVRPSRRFNRPGCFSRPPNTVRRRPKAQSLAPNHGSHLAGDDIQRERRRHSGRQYSAAVGMGWCPRRRPHQSGISIIDRRRRADSRKNAMVKARGDIEYVICNDTPGSRFAIRIRKSIRDQR